MRVCRSIFALVIICGWYLPLIAKNNNNNINNSVVVKTSLNIPFGEEIAFPNDVEILIVDVFQNKGKLWFNNSSNSEVSLPSGDLGEGKFIFTGSADCYLNSENGGSRIGQLDIEKEAGNLIVSGDLTVINNLRLNNGIIQMSNQGNLRIDNSATDAIIFENSLSCCSYVNGLLTRSVEPGGIYQYPVGSFSGFYPFLIDNPKLQDIISVSFDETIPVDVAAKSSMRNLSIKENMGWRVEAQENEQNAFYPGLCNLKQENNNDYMIFYLPEGATSLVSQRCTPMSTYLKGTQTTCNGLYIFASIIGDGIVNFIYVDDHSKSTFEIENASDFSNIRLKVYNRIGALIFKSENYLNEFDARYYPDGTYFYEMTMVKNSNDYVLRNFIEIKHER